MEFHLSRKSKYFCCALILKKFLNNFFGVGTTVYASNRLESAYTEQEIKKMTQELEKELEFLFEEVVTNENGKIEFNKQLLIDKYDTDTAHYITESIKKICVANSLTSENNFNYLEDTTNSIQVRGDWLACMKGEILGEYVDGKAWGQVATYIAKNTIKFGIKMSVTGIVASLALSSEIGLLSWH